MYPGRFLICFLFGSLLTIAPVFAFQKTQPEYKRLFQKAENLSNAANHTDETDAQALKVYNQVIGILTLTKADPLFLIKTYISTGAFLQVLGRPKESISYFKNAFAVKGKMPGLSDSVLFRPLVYCGNSYYQLDKPDSAEIFYKQAENIAEKYPQVNELERLYNTLGVISYSTGNYKKSIPYYEKAISTLLSRKTYDNALLVTYKSNLATAHRKLKKFKEALSIYRELLPYHIETDNLLHNIGSTYLALGDGEKAAIYLKQVKNEDQNQLNDLGRAYYLAGHPDKAITTLQKAIDRNKTVNGSHKNTDYGLTLKYMADIRLQQNQPSNALPLYQEAIGNLLFDFRSTDIFTNPTDFNSVFNSAELLDALLAKAQAFDKLYKQDKKVKNLQASLQTYLSFYKLADHIERFYETDDARLLISDKKYASHQRSIDISLELFGLSKNKKYIEQAFLLDEENKANTLSLYLEEAKIKVAGQIPPQLLKQETELKENITRELLKASAKTDSVELNHSKEVINNYTIRLLRVQQKMRQQNGYNSLQFGGETTDIKTLQKNIPAGTAVLSYHIGNSSILCFVITTDRFEFFTMPLRAGFSASLKEIYRQAQYREGNNSRQLRDLAHVLYSELIKPATPYLAGKKDLMIIPDDELNYLPFEILSDNEGETLLKKYTITYNYSCGLLQNNPGSNADLNNNARLGMAPFDERTMSKGVSGDKWAQLPASKQEIETMAGTSILGKQATKQEFLKRAAQFNIIHLATHAYANDRDPNRSFIAFYPTLPDSSLDYKLYIPEVYNLKLNKTRLIILSACESGAGELVKGEGLMSLSRAFSYAGCNNIITSMWKADDASTAYIAGKLHHYLQKGYAISAALRRARLDYLGDDQITSAKKLPGYWAQLRLTGGFEQQKNSTNYWIIFVVIAIVGCCLILIKNRVRIKRPGSVNRGI